MTDFLTHLQHTLKVLTPWPTPWVREQVHDLLENQPDELDDDLWDMVCAQDWGFGRPPPDAPFLLVFRESAEYVDTAVSLGVVPTLEAARETIRLCYPDRCEVVLDILNETRYVPTIEVTFT